MKELEQLMKLDSSISTLEQELDALKQDQMGEDNPDKAKIQEAYNKKKQDLKQLENDKKDKKLNDQEILTHAGKISADEALNIAESEYEKFSENRRQIDADHADEELKKTIRKLTEGKQDSL
ncbi:MAG: hypothetical protein WCP55_18575 [Lentisphaerota bacterium]